MTTEPPPPSIVAKVAEGSKRTGLPLELEVVHAFSQAYFYVDHSVIYVDPESGKSREVDLVVSRQHQHMGAISVHAAIECKASGKPWLIVVSDQHRYRVAPERLGILSPYAVDRLGGGGPFGTQALMFAPPGLTITSLACPGIALKQAFGAKDADEAYGVATSVVKAALAVSRRDKPPYERISFTLPVIVVDSPIIECKIDVCGTLRFEETDFAEFIFSAYLPDHIRTSVRVVHRSAVNKLVTLCETLDEQL